MVEDITDLSKNGKNAVLGLFVGDRLGSGSYRHVFELRTDPTCVVKVEHSGVEFCNVVEWQVWKAVEHTPVEEWFAPCLSIDLLGLALIQKRTRPFVDEAHFREELSRTRGLSDSELPPFFDDIHFANFGMLDGRVVCHDYGFNNFLTHGVQVAWQEPTLIEDNSCTAPLLTHSTPSLPTPNLWPVSLRV